MAQERVGQGQAERTHVEEDQACSAPLGVCRIRGQRSLTTQRSIAAWSRSAARRLGRWTVQPSRWCSSAHTQAGWWRTPVSRSITTPMRSRVHSSPVNPFARGALEQGLLDLGELLVGQRWPGAAQAAAVQRLDTAGPPASVPDAHGRGGDAKLAGDLSLAHAGSSPGWQPSSNSTLMPQPDTQVS
jgi:hypothetical protein